MKGTMSTKVALIQGSNPGLGITKKSYGHTLQIKSLKLYDLAIRWTYHLY